MKLYLAVQRAYTPQCNLSKVIGVFSSKKKALIQIKLNCFEFSKAKLVREDVWRYVFDGELTYYYEIEQTELNKNREEYE